MREPVRIPTRRVDYRDKQRLRWIQEHVDAKGYPPTVREIQWAEGWKSSSSAQMFLERMQAAGLVDWSEGQVRTLRLTELGKEVLK